MIGEESEIASVALFGFILGETEEEKIEAFNQILDEVGVGVKLVKECDHFRWCGQCDESKLAEEIFDEVANLMTSEKITDYMSQDRVAALLRAYDITIRNIKRRNETLRWIDECTEHLSMN